MPFGIYCKRLPRAVGNAPHDFGILFARYYRQISSFGARVDGVLGESREISFSDVMCAINAAEFGDGIGAQEILLLADGVAYLERNIMSEAGPLKRAVYKYFGLMS